MSSLQKTTTGYRIQFRVSGKAQTLSLGKIRKPEAESYKLHVDRLILAHKGSGTLTAIDEEWIRERPDEIKSKLRALGLIESENTHTQGFVSDLDDYTGRMRTWTDSTVAAWRTHRRRSGPRSRWRAHC